MTKRRYRFLRLTALLMIILGVLIMLAGIIFGLILIIRPSLLLPLAETVDVRSAYTVTGAVSLIGGMLGGLLLTGLGQYYQAFLEMLEVNRLQVKGLKALVDR